MLEKIKELIENLIFYFKLQQALVTDNSLKCEYYYFATKKRGSDPASPLRDRSQNNYNRGRISEEETAPQEPLGKDSSDLDNQDNDDDDDGLNDESLAASGAGGSSGAGAGATGPAAATSPLAPILASPVAKFALATALAIGGIILFIMALFPRNIDAEKFELCGGKSKLDRLKVITTGPYPYNIHTGERIGPRPWWDAFDFYDYVAAVVNLEAGDGGADSFFGNSSISDEDKEKRRYYKAADFAYYQSQALAAASYALATGNYSEQKLEANRAKYFEKCPILNQENMTEEEIEEIFSGGVRYSGEFDWLTCQENWPPDVDIIFIQNSNANAGACDLDYGCVGWGSGDDPNKPLYVCAYKINEEGEYVFDPERSEGETGTYCNYSAQQNNIGNHTNMKVAVRQNCLTYYKTNNDHRPEYWDGLEYSCKNIYCKVRPDDEDCHNGDPYNRIPERGFIMADTEYLKPGIKRVKEENREKWLKKAHYMRESANSIRGIVMTDINGRPKSTPWKSSGKGTTAACKGTWGDEYPPQYADMCHDKSKESDALNSWRQATELRWPLHKIMAYWYPYYFSSWSEEGRNRCRISSFEVDPKKQETISVLNIDPATKAIKYPKEKTFGNIIIKYTDESLIERFNVDLTVINQKNGREQKVKAQVKKGSNAIFIINSVSGNTIYNHNCMSNATFNSANKTLTVENVQNNISCTFNYISGNDISFPSVNVLNSEIDPSVPKPSEEATEEIMAERANLVHEKYNRDIYIRAKGSTSVSGQVVASIPVTLLNNLWFLELTLPYTRGGRYNEFGINPNWGLPNGNYTQGIDGIGLVDWSMKNGKINRHVRIDYIHNIEGQSSLHPFSKYPDSDNRRVVLGDFGDILYSPGNQDAKFVVGYYFNDKGVITGNIVLAATDVDKGIQYEVVSVRTLTNMVYYEYEREVATRSNSPQAPYADGTGSTESVVDIAYVDACYYDPESRVSVPSGSSGCSNSYGMLDFSACYRNRQTYNDIKMCTVYTDEEYFKGVFDEKDN